LKKLLHRFELRLALITAVALLIAQIGAMSHAYSHGSDQAAVSSHPANSASHAFCGDCLNFAPLLAAAGTPATLPKIAPQGRTASPRSETASLLDRRPAPSFRSRAPPITH
jgi:hypothetical protein